MQLTFAAVALVPQPSAFRPPEEFFRLPGVGTAASEAKGFEAHGFQRHVTGEHVEVGPGEVAPVFLLDRPQQAPGLVQRSVVRPAVERGETLLATASAATAIGDPVGTGAMPGEPDEQAAVVAEICRPPVLRVSHQGMQVGDHRVKIKGFKRGRVVEIAAIRIGARRVLVE